MLIAIRDDDICYFTKPEQLRLVYEPYWNICPITLSVIPFVDGLIKTKDELVPLEYQGIPMQFPIGQNKKLITYLKEQIQESRIGISMHGYTHLSESGIPEFESDKDFSGKVPEGKKYLEELFDMKVNVFTAPNNSMSANNAKAVIDAGLNIAIAYGFYPWERPVNYKTLNCFINLFIHHLKYKRKYPYPGVLFCGTHKEYPCVVIGEQSSYEGLKETFEFLQKNRANMCIATHYAGMCCMPKLKKIFSDFMDFIISNYRQAVQFVTIDKLFDSENSK